MVEDQQHFSIALIDGVLRFVLRFVLGTYGYSSMGKQDGLSCAELMLSLTS